MKLAVVTNILTPYRAPLFEAIAKHVDGLTVFLMAASEENRDWEIGPVSFKTELLRGVHFKPRSSEISLHWNYGVIGSLRRADPDVVLSGGFAPANIETYLYCKLFGKAYVGWGEFTLRDNARSSAIRRMIRRVLTKGSAASIASSTEARDAFVHYGAKPDSVLTSLMPIDVERFHRDAAAFRMTAAYRDDRKQFPGPILLSVGRLTAVKGIRELLSIFEIVQSRRPDVSLLIVGDGPGRAEYERIVEARALRQVHFLGFLDQEALPRYLALADLFLFPTLWDPFGAVLAEAMAAELPVVSSIFAASTGDLVVDGVNGYRIIPTLHEASASAVLEILESSVEERAAMGRAGYETVKAADVPQSAEAMVRFLRAVRVLPAFSDRPSRIQSSSKEAAG